PGDPARGVLPDPHAEAGGEQGRRPPGGGAERAGPRARTGLPRLHGRAGRRAGGGAPARARALPVAAALGAALLGPCALGGCALAAGKMFGAAEEDFEAGVDAAAAGDWRDAGEG